MRKTSHTLPLLPVLLTITAARADVLQLQHSDLQQRANGVLALMSYSVTPDLASSSLHINDKEAGNPGLVMSQLGGGATISRSTPLYLEGAVAFSRYDPRFVASDGTESQTIPVKWTTASATGGIGWDFPLTDELVLRPIVDVALGYITSDINAGRVFINYKFDRDIEFLDNGHMSAVGLGGALMLDWERVRPDYETDVELRYTRIELHSIGGDSAVEGHANAETASLYARWRAPTGLIVMQRPLRYVLEFSHSEYLGDQRGALGFDRLSTFGVGIEFDSSAHHVYVTRTRLLIRQDIGDHISGYSLSLAVSF